MKDNKDLYKRLRLNILFHTIILTLITGVAASVILIFITQVLLEKPIESFFISIFKLFGMSSYSAAGAYEVLIYNNRYIFLIIVLAIISFIIYDISLKRTISYIDDVANSLTIVLDGTEEPVRLIDELSELEDKLNELKSSLQKREKKAVETEKRKSELIAYLAHDIRTPLSSIIANLSPLMDRNNLSENDQKYIHIIYEKANRLRILLDEFFDIARYNLNDIKLEEENFDLTIMLEQIADEMYSLVQSKNLKIQIQSDAKLPVYGDPEKLARVFDNLLKNAISYSWNNTTIDITAREVGTWIEIVFTNQGETIDQEALSRIFDKFYRADNSRSARTGGAGLGLAIAKEIVDLHDGDISVTSIENVTRFVVILPEQSKEARQAKQKRQEERIQRAIDENKISTERSINE